MLLPVVSGLGGRPFGAAALLAVLLARVPVVKVLTGATGPGLIEVLGDTGKVQLLFGVLFAGGLSIIPS